MSGSSVSLQIRIAKTGVERKRSRRAMARIKVTADKLVLKHGSTTLTLDEGAGKASLQQKLLLWREKPVEFPHSDIDDIGMKSDKAPMSGASIHHSVIHRRTGEIAVLTTEEASDAVETVKKLRAFVGRYGITFVEGKMSDLARLCPLSFG
jgi:hypothetical protein